ncbi:hypothetical protein MRX96_026314 [Rhipicephalus microplus]
MLLFVVRGTSAPADHRGRFGDGHGRSLQEVATHATFRTDPATRYHRRTVAAHARCPTSRELVHRWQVEPYVYTRLALATPQAAATDGRYIAASRFLLLKEGC